MAKRAAATEPVRVLVTTTTPHAIDVCTLDFEDLDAATVAADVINSEATEGYTQRAIVID